MAARLAAGRNGLLQLIVAVSKKIAGRGDLRDRRVVREHQLGVDVRVLAELVVTHRAQAVAALGALVVVERAVVVQVRIRVVIAEGGVRIGREIVGREVREAAAAFVDEPPQTKESTGFGFRVQAE
jgi:hypothetical protein